MERKKRCSNCIHWEFNSENGAGICVWMHGNEEGVNYNSNVPFWANKLSFVVEKTEGKNCLAFEEW